ncbi:endonuclease/exonuclease/phosphatase family protein [Metabacillus arenae]|uniref:Endonuclease/exonuclease/phosphatase family protein n=1 Tax=Metabacillus arenae TaxID=2771434 RepID=A0A926NK26_9BACI|nr:endonuclease/exonuclease/phosphatase family protein [Metabacillus arenae]MBD1382033.1 endonuclease/exonuclease/phosphatase family protein [Metabacillus arenae]
MENKKRIGRKVGIRKVLFVLTITFLIMSLSGLGNSSFAKESNVGRGKSVNVKVMSFNIHHAEGVDGVLDLERIAKIIEDSNTAIVGLQEVDNHWSERSDFQDQAKWLAKRLGMFYTYAANLDREPVNDGEPRRQYGTAILSKYPIIASENHFLTKIGNTEQRGLLEATINVKGNHLHFYNTHLALTSAEREIQINEVIDIASQSKGPKVIVGDLNATPESNEMKPMNSHYLDVFAGQTSNSNTYPAENPAKRIDYIFTSDDIETVNTEVIDTLASDHLPITAKIVLDRKKK